MKDFQHPQVVNIDSLSKIFPSKDTHEKEELRKTMQGMEKWDVKELRLCNILLT